MPHALFLMTDPRHFEVVYQINPWMDPAAWGADHAGCLARAAEGSRALKAALEAAGAEVVMVPPAAGLPDLVFPANAAIVLDGRVLLARFRHPQRRGEQPLFRAAFEALQERLDLEIVELPPGCFHEGAGDAIWDAARGLFWAAHGPRSSFEALATIADVFGKPVVPLELRSDRFYHLDTCFCPLSGGEVLYYPPAFTAEALAAIRANVPPELRIEATSADAAAFCVNAVNIGRTIIMARAPDALRQRLAARGYRVVEVDLSSFMLSGGAAYCMTLRLDRASGRAATATNRPRLAVATAASRRASVTAAGAM